MHVRLLRLAETWQYCGVRGSGFFQSQSAALFLRERPFNDITFGLGPRVLRLVIVGEHVVIRRQDGAKHQEEKA